MVVRVHPVTAKVAGIKRHAFAAAKGDTRPSCGKLGSNVLLPTFPHLRDCGDECRQRPERLETRDSINAHARQQHGTLLACQLAHCADDAPEVGGECDRIEVRLAKEEAALHVIKPANNHDRVDLATLLPAALGLGGEARKQSFGQ